MQDKLTRMIEASESRLSEKLSPRLKKDLETHASDVASDIATKLENDLRSLHREVRPEDMSDFNTNEGEAKKLFMQMVGKRVSNFTRTFRPR